MFILLVRVKPGMTKLILFAWRINSRMASSSTNNAVFSNGQSGLNKESNNEVKLEHQAWRCLPGTPEQAGQQ
jgi:hypothetical protein